MRAAGDRAELEISDTGVGISAESLPGIFEWYRQAEAGEHAVDAGLGVGLALVKQLVELHGGTRSGRERRARERARRSW